MRLIIGPGIEALDYRFRGRASRYICSDSTPRDHQVNDVKISSVMQQLGKPAPRQVDAKLKAVMLHGRGTRLVGLALSIAACCFCFLFVFPWALIDDAILDFGATRSADAVVVNSMPAKRAVGNTMAKRKQSVYVTEFKFVDATGVVFQSKSLGYEQLDQGSVHRAEYSRWGSSSVRLEGGFLASGGYPGGTWAVSFLSFSVFGVWSYRRWRRDRMQLLTQGRLARGCIERIWRDNSRDDAAGWVVFSFEADGHEVQLTEAVEGARFQRAKSLYDRATSISVLHSASGPRACIVLELFAPLVLAQE